MGAGTKGFSMPSPDGRVTPGYIGNRITLARLFADASAPGRLVKKKAATVLSSPASSSAAAAAAVAAGQRARGAAQGGKGY